MLHDFNRFVTNDRLRLPISVGSTLHAVISLLQFPLSETGRVHQLLTPNGMEERGTENGI
jgi:hypothetical protein